MESYTDIISRIVIQNLPLTLLSKTPHFESLSADDWTVLQKTYQQKGVKSLGRTAELIELLGFLRKKELYPEFKPQMICTDDAVLFWWRGVVLHLLHEIDEIDPEGYLIQTFPGGQTKAKVWNYSSALEATQQLTAILTDLYPQAVKCALNPS
jgi:hypothetical protein